MAAIITIGIDLESSRQALALARADPRSGPPSGLIPMKPRPRMNRPLRNLRVLAGDPKVLAVGEIGLDFFRNYSPREHQKACFRRCLQLAREVSLPIVIHDREAHEETLQILGRRKGLGDRRHLSLFLRGLGHGPALSGLEFFPFRNRRPDL